MELKNIVYEKSEGIGTITLNRPAKLNAIIFKISLRTRMCGL
jgi:enoyl-CoA hydratase/carnithine racemase